MIARKIKPIDEWKNIARYVEEALMSHNLTQLESKRYIRDSGWQEKYKEDREFVANICGVHEIIDDIIERLVKMHETPRQRFLRYVAEEIAISQGISFKLSRMMVERSIVAVTYDRDPHEIRQMTTEYWAEVVLNNIEPL